MTLQGSWIAMIMSETSQIYLEASHLDCLETVWVCPTASGKRW